MRVRRRVILGAPGAPLPVERNGRDGLGACGEQLARAELGGRGAPTARGTGGAGDRCTETDRPRAASPIDIHGDAIARGEAPIVVLKGTAKRLRHLSVVIGADLQADVIVGTRRAGWVRHRGRWF